MPVVSHRPRPSWTTVSIILLVISLLAKVVAITWFNHYLPQREPRAYSYVGDDYPMAWPITRSPVLMASDNTARFRLNTTDGAAEWSAIVPGDGLVRLGPYRQPYTISMLHQLRCLGILRKELLRSNHADEGPTDLGRHCLNYLRQMVLCRGDIQLEPFQYASHEDTVDLTGNYECKDWGAVYDAVLENQRTWKMA